MIREIQPQANPFPYGWRYIKRELPDGRIDFDQVPLTLEDVLHPQMGDVMPQSPPHERDRLYLFDVLKNRTATDPHALVETDLLIIWDIPGLRQHSPDLSVFFDVDDPLALRNSFKVADEGMRPRLLIEIVSPDYRDNDVETKVDHYERAGVPWYVIVDRKDLEGPVRLIGFQRGPAGFEPMAPNEHGWLWLEPVGIWLGTGDNRVTCFDGDGKEIGDYDQMCHNWAEAEAKAAEEIQARTRAEAKAAEEAHARTRAEAKAAEEAHARTHAEAKAAEEAHARTRAEAKTAEAEARAADESQARARAEAQTAEAERRLRELEEKLRRLQGP
jgi:Uma2 family endonuclease